MAARIIFLRVGDRDRISLSDFIQSLNNFLGVLRDFDATLSNDAKGSLTWEVVSLKKESPAIVGVSANPRSGMIDHSQAVEAQVLESTAELTARGERTRAMSDSALMKIQYLAQNTKRVGPHSIFVNGDGHPKKETLITEKTFENARQFTSPKFYTYGSITGRLEFISVHKGDEFRIWDELTGKPVRCKFDVKDDQQVRDLLRHRVIVSGEISSNSAGQPISLKLAELRGVDEKRNLPTIEQMRGVIKDFTDGLTLKEYLKEIADE